MANEQERLSEDIHLLGGLLGETLVEEEGRSLFDLVEEVRALAKAYRGGDESAGERLVARLGEHPRVPIILTGAMRPYELRSSDSDS